jgi:hypothetical protein
MAIQLNHRQNRISTGSNAETAGVNLEIFNTGAIILPKGTDAEKTGSAVAGAFRFNTTNNTLEYHNGTAWNAILSNYVEDLRSSTGTMIVDGVDVASAVNFVQISNAAAAGTPEIRVDGTDTNIPLNIESKGTGAVTIGTGLGNVATFVSGGPQGFEFRAGSTTATMRTDGDMAIDGDVVKIQNLGFTVAEFVSTVAGQDEKLEIKAEVSGISLTVFSGANPGAELHIRQQLDMSGNKIVNLADPAQPQDGATKAYVDAAINGLDWKNSVKVATTANVDLATGGLLTIDGYQTVAGDRVLVKAQTTLTENGLYVAAAGSWARSEDANNLPGQEVSEGLAVYVEEGATHAATQWVITEPAGAAIIGTSNIVFTQFGGAGSLIITGGNGITSTQLGQNWTIDADADESTIGANIGGKLAVRSTGTAGQTLLSNGTAGQAAVWGALNLANANAVTGVLPEANGGTGESTFAEGDLLVGDASNGLVKLTKGTNGQFLQSNGTTLVYASASINDLDGFNLGTPVLGQSIVFDGTNWVNGGVNLANSAAVSGILNVQNGGTGLASVTQGQILMGGATASALATITVGAATTTDSVRVLTSNDGTTPAFGTITLNQLADVSAVSPASGSVLAFVSGEWVPANANDTDKFVKVNAADTTSSYLQDKVGVDDAGALSVATSGNSRVQFSVNVDNVTVGKANGNNLAVRSTNVTGQVLRSTGTDGADAVWGALDLNAAAAVTGVLNLANGGTGLSTVPANALVYGAASGSALSTLTLGTAGQVLRSNGTTLAWASASFNDLQEIAITGAVAEQVLVYNGTQWVNAAIDLSAASAVEGVLPVSHGGTGLAALAANELLLGNGGDAMTALAGGAASTSNLGTVLTVNTSGDVAWGSLTLGQLSNVADTAAGDTDVLQWSSAASQWQPVSLGALDKLVRVSPTDTTSGTLSDKLVGASGGAVTFAIANGSGDEDYTISVNVDNETLIKVGNNLTVGNDSDVTNKYLRGAGANAAAQWVYISNLRDATTGAAIINAGGSVTNGNQLAVNATDTATTLTSQEDMFIVAASGNNVSIQGTVYPNTVPARSVLVANGTSTLVALTAEASGNQMLRWNNTVSAFEFIEQGNVGGFAFRDYNLTGNGNNVGVSATSTSDAMTIVGGTGIAVDGASKQLTFSQTLTGLTSAAATGSDILTFWDGSTLSVTTVNNFLDDNDVVSIPEGSLGMLVQTSAGEFAARTIVAKASADQAGITVLNGSGVAGNPEIGLDIAGLTEAVSIADKANDFVVMYDASADANVKITVSALVGGIDNTRINDAANATFVDTDQVASTVIIGATSATVAEFAAGSDAQFFRFEAGTSAGTIRMEANGTATDIDIRIVPKGTGEVFIGDSGNGSIQADNGFDLTVAGGDGGGDLFLKAGTGTGVVEIQNNAGNDFVTFGNDQSVTHFGTAPTSFTRDFVAQLTTTGAASATADFALAANTTALVEVYVVARETGSAAGANSGGYKLKGVMYNNSGTATVLGTVAQEILDELPVGMNATFAGNGANVRVTVTGDAAANMTWTVFVKMVAVTV